MVNSEADLDGHNNGVTVSNQEHRDDPNNSIAWQ